MPRFDKYDPVDGGFRAALAAEYTGSAAALGVGLDTNGRVVPGAGVTGVVGVICQPVTKAAGTVIDLMHDGEILEFSGDAGSLYYADATTGVISVTPSPYLVGFCVEASRLHVRLVPLPPASTTVVGDQAAVADLDMTGLAAPGTPNGAIEAIPDPADAPGTADALRDDLVANTLPAVRNAIEECGTHINTLITRLESAGLLTP